MNIPRDQLLDVLFVDMISDFRVIVTKKSLIPGIGTRITPRPYEMANIWIHDDKLVKCRYANLTDKDVPRILEMIEERQITMENFTENFPQIKG